MALSSNHIPSPDTEITAGWGSDVVKAIGYWEATTGNTTMVIGKRYIANSASRLEFTLPGTAAIGDVVEIQGKGAGGWRIKMQGGQSIFYGSSSATGSQVIDSGARYDSLKLICITANTDWAINTSYSTIATNNSSPQFLANNASWSASANDGAYESIHTALSMSTGAQRVLHFCWSQDNGSAAFTNKIKNLYNSTDETVDQVQMRPRRTTYTVAGLTAALSAGVNTFVSQAARNTNVALNQIRACAIELPATNESTQTLYQALVQDSTQRTVTNSSYTNIPSYTLTGTCITTKALILGTCRGGHSGTRHQVQYRFAVDGAGVGYTPRLTSSSSDDQLICMATLADVTAGSRTFTWQVKNDGTNTAANQYAVFAVAQLPATINGATALRAQVYPSTPAGITAGSGSPVEVATTTQTMGGVNWALILFGGDYLNSDATKFGYLQIKIDGVAVGSAYKFGDIDGSSTWPHPFLLPWFTTSQLSAGSRTFSVDAYTDSGNTFTIDNLQLTVVEFG